MLSPAQQSWNPVLEPSLSSAKVCWSGGSLFSSRRTASETFSASILGGAEIFQPLFAHSPTLAASYPLKVRVLGCSIFAKSSCSGFWGDLEDTTTSTALFLFCEAGCRHLSWALGRWFAEWPVGCPLCFLSHPAPLHTV